MRKRILAVFTAALCLAAFTGCEYFGRGKDDGKDTPNEGQTVIIVGDYVSAFSGLNAWTLMRQAAFDEAYPDIKVLHVANPNTDSDKQVQSSVTALQSGTSYTLLTLTANVYARTLWNTGLIEDFAPYMQDWDAMEFMSPDLLQSFMRKDKMIGFPIQQEMVGLGINRYVMAAMNVSESEIVDENGASRIDTWQKFYDLALRLTSSSPKLVNGKIVQSISGYSCIPSDFYLGLGSWLIANGLDLATQGEDRQITLNYSSDKVIETFELFMDMKAAGIMPANLNFNIDAFFSSIFDNKVGSFIFYPSWSSWFTPLGMYNEDILMIPIPKGPSAVAEDKTVPNYTTCYVLSKKAAQAEKEAAALYVRFMTGPEAWEEKIRFIAENEIGVFATPQFTGLDTTSVFDTLPLSWQTTIVDSQDNLWNSKLDSDNWKEYLARYIPGLISGNANSSGHNIAALKSSLAGHQATTYNEWLTAYNQKVLQGQFD